MDKAIKSISKEMQLQTQEILSSNNDLYGKAYSLMRTVQAYQTQVKQHAIESVNAVYKESHAMQDFLAQYNDNLENTWVNQLYLVLEKTNEQMNGVLNMQTVEALMKVFNKEFSYMYKNIQHIVIKETNVPMKFVAHQSCCNVCKFLAQNEFVDDGFIAIDDCDSYYIKHADMMLVDNLISQNIKIYNVPVKYKKSLSTFYKMIELKYGHMLKQSVKIKFLSEFTVGEEHQNIAEMIEYCYDQESQEYKIKFDEKTYRQYILKSLLKVNIPDKVRELYYYKIGKDVIFQDSKFISYLAEQNAENYFMESCIAYILSPQELEEIDKKMYDILEMEFERR